ncbi:MAG TPA: protein kinase [Polyangiales bacterium]|nr:protein kinase [Polyangiales bacterium]
MSLAGARTSSALQSPGLEPSALIAGRYRVCEQLGTGGMGVVYRVNDEAGGGTLALKQLSSAQPGARHRKLEALFEREYHTLVRLKHPRIIEVYDYGLSELGPYYTMELLEGGDLQQQAPLPWREVCSHLCDVASSLALLHAHRLVHRDISPRNVRLTGDGRAKLIDFGALGAFGPALDVVGTPLCMAPEVYQRGSLDQRSDLFALGVVGYFALTGRHAFPARSTEDLPACWARGAVPPAQLQPEIPAELNELILSLISSDPLARPLHAAQVIDQLCAIAGLEISDSELAAESYLASGRLVGRATEQEWLDRRVRSPLTKQGSEVFVSGASGIGKTRLLRELALDARVLGMLVLERDAQATSGYFGLAVALALDLLERGGALARECAERYAGLLQQLSPQLRERFAGVAPELLPPNPAEQRARFQTALLGWFSAVADTRPILLSVDNLHAADESSAAFLVMLGNEVRSRGLLTVCSLRAGEPIAAPQPVGLLRSRSAQLKLEALSPSACDELVQSLFGDVVNSARLAKLLFEKSAGNPQHCMELARLLARKQIARYAAGTWVLPIQVSSDELPDRLEDLFAAKLASLSPDARALAEALSLHPRPVSIELCIAFAEGLSDAQAHAALDELSSQQILLSGGDSYQFAQQSLRVFLMDGLPPERARALHRRAASVFEGTEDLELRMQRGWHLLRAGEELAGAELLASTSRAFINTASAREESRSVIEALRAALDVYERHGRSPHERAALLFPLVLLCYYCPDRSLILHYAPQALRLGLDITGLGAAYKMHRLVGKERALRWGMHLAERRFAKEREQRGLQLSLQQAVAAFSSLVPASVGAFACHYDTAGASEIGRLAEPLSLFPDDQLPALMYAWKQGQECNTHGLDGDTFINMSRVLEHIDRPHMRQALGDAHWRSLRGGAMFMVGLASCYRGRQSAVQMADDMDRLGVRLWAMVADQVRLLHHTYRGEASHAQHFRERVERFAMLGGPTWHTEMFWPAAMLHGEVLCGDTIAVRRTFQQLERTSREVPSLGVYADCAKAAYLSLRGDHAQAIALYERIIVQLAPRRSVSWLPTRGQFAQALNRAGEHERAKQLLLATLEHVTETDRGVRVLCFEVRRQLAVAQAALGDTRDALAALEEMIQEYEADHNPLLLGLLHETRAQCALSVADRDGFDAHLARAQVYFLSTHNPVLVAHVTLLKQLSLHVEPQAAVVPSGVTRELLSELGPARGSHSVGELLLASDRERYALELLIERTRAKGGCLYLLDGDGGLQLAAASAIAEPPRELERELSQQLQRSQSLLDALDAPDDETRLLDSMRSAARNSLRVPAASVPANDRTSSAAPRGSQPAHVFSGSPTAHTDQHYSIVLLTSRSAGQATMIGGAILTLEPGTSVTLDPQLVLAIADAIAARR